MPHKPSAEQIAEETARIRAGDQGKTERIFNRAADLRDAQQRTAYLDEACGADQELRAAVERLLKHDSDAGSFLDAPAVDLVAAPPTIDQPITEKPGTVIDRYGKGDRSNLCEAPEGPSRQIGPVPFSVAEPANQQLGRHVAVGGCPAQIGAQEALGAGSRRVGLDRDEGPR